MKLINLMVVFLFIILFFSLPIFGGDHFCVPLVEDLGPGTVGCFYSSN